MEITFIKKDNENKSGPQDEKCQKKQKISVKVNICRMKDSID